MTPFDVDEMREMIASAIRFVRGDFMLEFDWEPAEMRARFCVELDRKWHDRFFGWWAKRRVRREIEAMWERARPSPIATYALAVTIEGES